MTDPFARSSAPEQPLYGAPLYGEPYGSPSGPQAGARNRVGGTALALGIAAIVLFWVPFVGALLGVAAIVFATRGRRRVHRGEANNNGVAVAGLATGIVGVVLGTIFTMVVMYFATEITDYSHCMEQASGEASAEQECVRQLTDRLTERLGG